jgi:HSP20 family protein
MSLALRTNGTVSRSTDRYRDPFAIARDLLTWDPFFVSGGAPRPAFAPAFEVKDTADAYVLKADLPGLSEADLEISVHNNTLTVAGSRTSEERKEGESYSLYERQFGSFTRSFSLPELADGEKIAAKLDAGVLTLTIGKKAEAKPRKIAVAK